MRIARYLSPQNCTDTIGLQLGYNYGVQGFCRGNRPETNTLLENVWGL